MKPSMSMIAWTAVLVLGGSGSLYAADSMSGKGQQGHKDSESGLKGKSSDGMASQGERRELGAGPMGEESKGGSGQSGTKGLPPGKAPGFEGANKEPGRAPTAGGH
jgi:hypothetical protein